MGLRRAVHVLVFTRADGVPVRLAVERQVRALRWALAWSPADADVLAVCGSTPGGDDVVGRIWEQIPGPRARLDLIDGAAVRAQLEQAAASLDDDALQERLARAADEASRRAADHAQINHEDMDGGDGGAPEREDGGAEQGDMGGTGHGDMGGDRGGMGGMDHGDMGAMDMSGPAGIPLAGSADHDRDGLEMDEWHVVLGAGLPAWPAGLVVRATLHGDVVAGLETLADPTPGAPTREGGPDAAAPALAVDRPALLLDAAASVLELAGWSSAAAAVRRLRDDLLDGSDPRRLVARAERLARRVRRSLVLRWSLEGMHRRPDPAQAGHVVRARLLALLDDAVTSLREPGTPLTATGPVSLAALPDLAVGQELGTLRLLVASLALDAGVVTRA